MASHDSDQNFADALGRHLRHEASRGGTPHDIECPDAEILAAYHERALLPEQMLAWKGHIAGCARCQEVLSVVETAELGEADLTEREVAAFPAVAAAAPAPLPVAAPAPEKPRTEPKRRMMYWQWLAPAGAIAASVLIWIAAREKPVSHPRQDDVAVVAQNREQARTPAQAAPPAAGTVAQPSPSQGSAGPKRTVPKALADQTGGAGAMTGLRENTKDRRGGVVGGIAGGGASASSSSGFESKPKSLDQEIRPDKGAAPTNAARDRGAPAAPPPAPPVSANESVTVQTYAAAPAETAPKEKQEQPSTTAGAALALKSAQNENRKNLPSGIRLRKAYTSTPDNSVQWNFGSAGQILRSTDGGATWTTQHSGVFANLAAGSASSPAVCWAVGAQGTILLTTDGEHWRTISSPTTDDLTGVAAKDALHAEVWSDSPRARYVTEDGGKTWTQTAKP